MPAFGYLVHPLDSKTQTQRFFTCSPLKWSVKNLYFFLNSCLKSTLPWLCSSMLQQWVDWHLLGTSDQWECLLRTLLLWMVWAQSISGLSWHQCCGWLVWSITCALKTAWPKDLELPDLARLPNLQWSHCLLSHLKEAARSRSFLWIISLNSAQILSYHLIIFYSPVLRLDGLISLSVKSFLHFDWGWASLTFFLLAIMIY